MFKRICFAITLLALISLKSFSQSITNYSFSSTSGSFTSLSGGTVPSLISGLDDGYMNGIPIGFDFFYMGGRYTTLSLSTNGWLLLGSDITDAAYWNDLKYFTQRPIIAPLWDDLQLSASTDVTYLTSGSAGSRVLTLEVLKLKWDYSQSNASMSFQVKLYESTGKIEFIYRRESAANGSASASIGITGTSTGNGNYLSLNGSGSSPSVSSTTETTNISSRPSNGRTFTFSQTSPTAPGSLSYNSITTTSLKLNWTDNSGNETAFVIYSSTDGINYTYLAQTSANATSYTATGLAPGTTYYHRVYALREGALSTVLSGNQATTSCVPGTVSGIAVETCVGGSTGSITASATGGSAPYTYNLDGGSYQASATFTGLAAGVHTLNAKGSGGCVATTSVTVYDYAVSADNQNSAGNDSWVGHAYDGTNFSTYIGNFTETESFNELFGGTNNCFGITSNLIARSIYTESFSVKFRMNSTRRGLYAVDLGSDDGSRLTIDGSMIYDNWWDQGFTTKSSQMINLTGSSSLLYEFYENSGGNQVMFQNITTLISNVLSTNTSQNICLGNSGASISGNIFGSLPSGIAVSGTGYQWTYSTSPGGARSNISGATSATYTPATTAVPFNAAGTYYIYRNAVATSTNNIGYGSYTATSESNAATIVVNTPPSATISYTGNPYCASTGLAAVTRTGTTGGSYSITGGLSINGSTGDVTLTGATAGSYTVTYTIAASGGCTIYSVTAPLQLYTIINNQLDYTNGSHGTLCTTVGENATATLTAPSGAVFTTVNFASYGTPSGSCGSFATGSCHATTSQLVAESYLLGNNTGSIPATNTVFGDPCSGTYKSFYVQATYTQPICSGTSPGTLTGTTPTGGNGAYTYLWESSTTSATSGFSAASGTNNSKDYTAGTLTQTTWYRRSVMSGGCTNVSTVIIVVVNTTPAATISYSGTPFCKSAGVASVTRSGTSGGTYTAPAGLTINAGTGAITPSSSTAGTYLVTYSMTVNGCSATATTSVTITATPSATISYSGTPYCSSAGIATVTQTGTAGGAYSSTGGLSINSSTGAINLSASTAGSYTVTYTVTASGGCALYQTSTPINIVAPGTWTGSIDDNWSNSGNWLCGAIPTITQDVIIHNGLTNYPVVVSGTGTVKDLTIESGGSIILAGGGLQISGTISNLGTFDVTAGTIELNGSTMQTIPANTFTKDTILNLIVNNDVTLGGSLSLAGTLTFGTSNKTFATNGYLTLQSSSTGTAKIAPLPADGSGNATSFITGNVTVERFIPGSRAWRLLTSPLSNTASIYDSWQNSGTYTPGKGMFVTGPNPQPSNGLDASPLNTISMKSYNSGTQAFANISNTKSSNLSNSTGNGDNIGYFVFVRGDRAPGNITAISYNSTVLSGTGLLQTGKQTFNASGTLGNFTIVGNPYASPIDFNDVQRTHLMKRFYAWDATINQLGAYVIVDDIDGDGTFTKSIPSSSQDNHIQSGQAFFVLTDTAGAASLSFYENSKSTISKNAGFRPLKGLASMSVILNLLEADNSVKTADAVVAEFNDNFSFAVNIQDALKFGNINETFSLMRNGSSLGIERRPLINADDTLFLKLTKSTRRNYQFVIDAKDLDEPNLFGYLEDAYTKITTPVNLNGSTIVNFTIDASAASINPDRFKIVFKQAKVLPVTYTDVNANKQGKNIAVQWQVENQLNIRSYEVEKSINGSNFTKVNTRSAITSSTTATYNWLDKNAVTGDNFYRIRNIDLDGTTAYSKVVKVTIEKGKGEMVVYPNPVKNSIITLQLKDMVKGQYNYRLLNGVGQVLLTGSIDHAGGNVAEKIKLKSQIASGIYQLEVTEIDNSKTIIQVVVE
ncbi:MAG: fibronectin type III domain-containing protein [Ferruginibacter sp.]